MSRLLYTIERADFITTKAPPEFCTFDHARYRVHKPDTSWDGNLPLVQYEERAGKEKWIDVYTREWSAAMMCWRYQLEYWRDYVKGK